MKNIIYIVCLVASMFLLSVESQAQRNLYNSSYSTLELLTDTVTNTGTGAVGNFKPINDKANEVVIQVIATEISGTTGGTISILGSLDGTNYKAITVQEASTAVNTFTPADAVGAQVFSWRLKNNPYPYYKVSWTGTGTMSATVSAKLMIR